LFNKTLSRLPHVLKAVADSRTGLHSKISKGIFPSPVKLSSSGRAVAWPTDEVNAVIEARIAGQSDEQVLKLVAMLYAAR
jgi:prophage regulatory protein